MINQDQYIPCPTCQTKIPFDLQLLLKGVEFVCPNCQGSIGLAAESKGLVEETMNSFDTMKKKVVKMKEDKSNS